MSNNGQNTTVSEEASTRRPLGDFTPQFGEPDALRQPGDDASAGPSQLGGADPLTDAGPLQPGASDVPRQPGGPPRTTAPGGQVQRSGGGAGANPAIWKSIAPGSGSTPGAGNVPQPDPAKVAEDVRIVKACTTAVEAYRQGRVTKSSAIAALVFSFASKNRNVPSGIAPFVDQLDQHERARARAAAEGAARGADAVSGNRDQLAPQSARPSKRARPVAADYDSSDDDDSAPRAAKRSGYDPDAAAFRAELRPRAVPEHIQRTIEAQSNYLADLKRAKRDLLATGCAPAFPLDLWEDILASRAVDFDKILSSMFSHIIVDTTEHRLGGSDGPILHLPNIRPKKHVTDYGDWLLCFQKWSDAVCCAYPNRRNELLVYLEFFTDLFNSIAKQHHSRVIQADAAIRNASANDATLSLCDKERLHTLAARHVSPWGAEVSAARIDPVQRRTQPGSSSSQGRGGPRSGSAREHCRNWNRGFCGYTDCRHLHACDRPGCNGNHTSRDHDRLTSPTNPETTAGGGVGGQRGGGQRK